MLQRLKFVATRVDIFCHVLACSIWRQPVHGWTSAFFSDEMRRLRPDRSGWEYRLMTSKEHQERLADSAIK